MPPARHFGHAFGFVIRRLLGDGQIPVVPLLLNTFYPPNQPSPARCYALGKALRQAIEAYPEDLRVAVVASGGRRRLAGLSKVRSAAHPWPCCCSPSHSRPTCCSGRSGWG
jgi:aromatic ring-opening dioxygenase catalytic subunit (LigB family)